MTKSKFTFFFGHRNFLCPTALNSEVDVLCYRRYSPASAELSQSGSDSSNVITTSVRRNNTLQPTLYAVESLHSMSSL